MAAGVDKRSIGELQQLWDAFQVLDLDQSGEVSVGEVRHLFSELGLSVDPADVDALIQLFDDNDSGSIDFREFVELVHTADVFNVHVLDDGIVRTTMRLPLAEALTAFQRRQMLGDLLSRDSKRQSALYERTLGSRALLRALSSEYLDELQQGTSAKMRSMAASTLASARHARVRAAVERGADPARGRMPSSRKALRAQRQHVPALARPAAPPLDAADEATAKRRAVAAGGRAASAAGGPLGVQAMAAVEQARALARRRVAATVVGAHPMPRSLQAVTPPADGAALAAPSPSAVASPVGWAYGAALEGASPLVGARSLSADQFEMLYRARSSARPLAAELARGRAQATHSSRRAQQLGAARNWSEPLLPPLRARAQLAPAAWADDGVRASATLFNREQPPRALALDLAAHAGGGGAAGARRTAGEGSTADALLGGARRRQPTTFLPHSVRPEASPPVCSSLRFGR
jgi:hypothetical protein